MKTIPPSAFRARSLAEGILLLAVLAGLFQLYQPLHEAAWQGNQRFAEEQARLELFAPPIDLGASGGKLLPALCRSVGQHLTEAARRRFCRDGENLGAEALPKQFGAAAVASFTALSKRQETLQGYFKQRLAALQKQRGSAVLRAEKPDSLPAEVHEADEALAELRQRFNLSGDPHEDEPWIDLRCAYRQWSHAYNRSPAPPEAEQAETVFTLAALLDGVDIKTIPEAVFKAKAEGCKQAIAPTDIAGITLGLQDVYAAQAGLPKAKAMRELAQWAPWRFALLAVLAWVVLLLGRVSDAPLRVLALALPVWAGVGLGLDLVTWGWLAAACVVGLGCLRVPLAVQAHAVEGRRTPASIWVFPLVVMLMGLGFWLLIDQSLFFLKEKRYLALYHQHDVFAAFMLISCLPLAAPWLLGLAMRCNSWLLGAQNTQAKLLAVLLRYGLAAALVLGVVALAGRNFAFTSDWLKSWLILTSAGVFLSRGEVGTRLLGELSWGRWRQGLARLVVILLPLLLVSGIAVAGLLKTKDIGPLVVIVLAGAVLVGAIVFAALYASGSMARATLALLSGWAAALAWIALVVGAMFTLGGVFSRWLPHIRERLEAVADPYSSRNDQMALVGMFREKVPDGGFGLGGETPWCGYGSFCRGLPEQLASDYTVTALIGAFGLPQTLILLGVFCVSLVLLVRAHALAPQPAINAPDRWRSYAGWLALLWVLVTLAQTAMTLFGNLGRLPLSGITLPFVSYGTASLLANAFFLGLVLNVRRQPAAIPMPASATRPARPTLRVAAFAVLLPIALAVQAALYWAGRQAAQENAASRHHDKRLYAAVKIVEKTIMPRSAGAATAMAWQGPCKAAFTAAAMAGKETPQQRLDRMARIIQYRIDGLAVPDSPSHYSFDALAWSKQVELGVANHEFECDDARRALERLADGPTMAKLEWRGHLPKAQQAKMQPDQWVAVPSYLFDRRDPWIAANGCVVWGSGDSTFYLPSGRRSKGIDRCEQVARQDSGTVPPQPVVSGPLPDDPNAAAWSAPPSLVETLAPLAPLRDPGAEDFDELVGENRLSEEEPQQGLDLRLTIDPNAQRIAQQVATCAVGKGQAYAKVCQAIQLDGYGKGFKENARARMVGIALIHLASGEIRALASDHSDCYAADFDFRGHPKGCAVRYGSTVKPDALLNHALFNDYMPASTVKPIMALGFLADGVADKDNLQRELAKSDSVRFLDRLFHYERNTGAIQTNTRREELVRDSAVKVGWNIGCAPPGGADCGGFDPLFGRPTARRGEDKPIGLELLYGRFFVEPTGDGLRNMRLMDDLDFDAASMRTCAASRYDNDGRSPLPCRGKVAQLVSTGFGQSDSRATPVGIAGMMARLALAEQNQPAPWPHLVKGHVLWRIDGKTDYATAASTQDFKDDGRKLNADPPQALNPAHVKIVLDGLRQGHRLGTSEKAFDAAFKEGGSRREQQQNLERWRRLLIAGKTGTPSYKPGGHARPLKWYAGVFGPAGGQFEYAIAVLSERNWDNGGNIDDPHEGGSNTSAEIAFQVVKRLMPMPAPDAAPAAVTPPASAPAVAKPKAAPSKKAKPTTVTKPSSKPNKKVKP